MANPLVREAKRVIDTNLTLGFTTYVKNAFVLCLREAFAHENTPISYRYNANAEKSQIAIYRAFPKKIVKLPLLIVDSDIGDASISSLGEEAAFETRDTDGNIVGVTYCGRLTLPVNIRILTQTATDRERLTDMVMIYCRWLFYGVFARENIPFLGIQAGEDGDEGEGPDKIFKGVVTIRVESEYNQYVDQSLLDLFLRINLGDMLVGSKAADLQPNTNP